MNIDDEKFYSANSDGQHPSSASSVVYTADNVEAKQLSSKGEAFLGVPEQLSVCSADLRLLSRLELVQRVRFLVYHKGDRRSGATRFAHPSCRANSVLSDKELHAPLLDDESWLSDAHTSGTEAKGDTFGSTKAEALGEDGETASLSTDCLQEDLPSSDDEDFTWAPLEPIRCPQALKACGFDSDLEEWNFYF
eukprot:1910192-Amphidinium_carterae.1